MIMNFIMIWDNRFDQADKYNSVTKTGEVQENVQARENQRQYYIVNTVQLFLYIKS